jgi:hypothetical protein
VNPPPVGDVRFDGVSHFPSYAEKRQHCRNCPDGFTFVQCQKCNMHLSLNKNRNCFHAYHVKWCSCEVGHTCISLVDYTQMLSITPVHMYTGTRPGQTLQTRTNNNIL